MASDDWPDDPLKPALPYIPGARFDIKQHVPPEPTDRRFIDALVLKDSPDYLRRYGTPSRCCLARPPPTTEPHPNQTSYSLAIVDQLVTRDGRGPQLVLCRIGRHKAIHVAKIFDPLYYDWRDRADGVLTAHRDYATEATAYGVLVDEGHNGKSAPRYFGAWTFEIPLLDGSPRQVRMIVMDYVPLPSIHSLLEAGKADAIPQERRMQMLAKAMEHKSWLRFYGVEHGDFAPRNVLVDADVTTDQVKVVLVDFGRAIVRDLPSGSWFSSTTPEKRPCFPGFGFANSWREFRDWVPKELHPSRQRIKWLEQQWGASEVFEPPDALELEDWNEALDYEDSLRSSQEETTTDIVQ